MIVHTQQKGFVALMSVLLISSVLMIVIFALNLSSYFARFDVLGGENKRMSLGLAEACLEAAKLKIAQNPSYVPAAAGDSVSIGTQTCRICGVTGSNPYTIYADAVIGGAYSHLEVTGIISGDSFIVSDYVENVAKNQANCVLP